MIPPIDRRPRSARRSPSSRYGTLAVIAMAVMAPLAAGAEVPAEEIGHVSSLPTTSRDHWGWVSDPVLERSALVDLESGRLLGVVDGGWGFTIPLFSADGREIYVPETHYSRRSRGQRTDVVTFYDADTLLPTGEVVIPPRRAINASPLANAAISDDGRFLAVFNMNPATSLSIVDLAEQRFVEAIETPGCSLAYGAGERRFAMLCADGAMLLVQLDEAGHLAGKHRTDPFFDPGSDPVTEKAVRYGDRWFFVSFGGFVYEVDVSQPTPRFEPAWSLFEERERKADWKIGGTKHLAIHEPTGRFYSLVHQGPEDTHKSGGNEIWVYDLSERTRVQKIQLRNPGLTYLGAPMEFGQTWIWPFNRLYDGLLSLAGDALVVEEINVTLDGAPLLVTAGNYSGSLAIYDALSGEFLRRVTTGNMTSIGVELPYRSRASGGTRR
jgi:methylamine dehydrogenase heavy chain